MKTLTHALLAIFYFFSTSLAYAQTYTNLNPSSRGSEFFVGAETGKPLIAVSLIDGVKNPGVYHVPIDTPLAQLLAFAGGATERSDLSEITIRRRGKDPEILQVNLERELRKPSPASALRDGDTVHIDIKAGVEHTLQWTTIAAAIASIGLSVVLITDSHRR